MTDEITDTFNESRHSSIEAITMRFRPDVSALFKCSVELEELLNPVISIITSSIHIRADRPSSTGFSGPIPVIREKARCGKKAHMRPGA